MPITKQQVLEALKRVRAPGSEQDLVAAGAVEAVSACDGYVSVRLRAGSDPDWKTLRSQVDRTVRALGAEVKQVSVEAGEAGSTGRGAGSASGQGPGRSAGDAPKQAGGTERVLPDVQHIIAVGAGKGGVGKSTVAVNLAVGLARRGLRAGLLDGDIYGPSAPTLLGLAEQQLHGTRDTLLPFEVHGIRVMTMGKLVEPDKPLIWRGPMAHGAFRQLATQTRWGPLDYLIIDLPPGTGDVPLTMAQLLPLTGAVIACTPQKVAQDDAVRAAGMFRQLDVEVLGVVENMSYFVADDGKEYDIFGRGGAERMADQLGVPLLGTIPIHMALRANSDAGDPTANFEGPEALAQELEALVVNVMEQVQARADAGRRPSLNIS